MRTGLAVRPGHVAGDRAGDRADLAGRPTIGKGLLAFQIDHILGSKDVRFNWFRQVPESRAISDHTALVASAEY